MLNKTLFTSTTQLEFMDNQIELSSHAKYQLITKEQKPREYYSLSDTVINSRDNYWYTLSDVFRNKVYQLKNKELNISDEIINLRNQVFNDIGFDLYETLPIETYRFAKNMEGLKLFGQMLDNLEKNLQFK